VTRRPGALAPVVDVSRLRFGEGAELRHGARAEFPPRRFTHVPYKGGNDIMAPLLGGELQLSFASSTVVKGMRSRMKVLAVTCPQRDPALPDMPTMSEAGVKGYDASFWFGLLAPARTSQAIAQRLNAVLRETLGDAELMRPLQELGLIPAPSTPVGFAARIRADFVKWKDVLTTR